MALGSGEKVYSSPVFEAPLFKECGISQAFKRSDWPEFEFGFHSCHHENFNLTGRLFWYFRNLFNLKFDFFQFTPMFYVSIPAFKRLFCGMPESILCTLELWRDTDEKRKLIQTSKVISEPR